MEFSLPLLQFRLVFFQDSTTNMFEFEIIGGSSGQYAGIAFGSTNQMRDADLYYCTEGGLTSGAITGRGQTPTSSANLPVKQLECNYLKYICWIGDFIICSRKSPM